MRILMWGFEKMQVKWPSHMVGLIYVLLLQQKHIECFYVSSAKLVAEDCVRIRQSEPDTVSALKGA